ncbi:MAG: hypothetical protein WBZ35_03555, partial [Pseudolabrys sp.]
IYARRVHVHHHFAESSGRIWCLAVAEHCPPWLVSSTAFTDNLRGYLRAATCSSHRRTAAG